MDKGQIKYLSKKVKKTLREDGFKALIGKTTNYLRYNVGNATRLGYRDILFINGCTLPHPKRYRVDHQIEQLEAYGISASFVDYDKLTLDEVKYYRGFIFFRCPVTETIEEFIKIAKQHNKTVFYDIDDLVIDEKYTNTIEHLKTLSPEEKAVYDDGVNRMRKTLELCDYAITTTERLAKELSNYVKEVYINRNVASEKMVELSHLAMKNIQKDTNKIVLGYLSGSITHNEDFELILPVLTKIMDENDNVYLKIVGLLDVPECLKKYEDRLLSAPFVDWQSLPEIIASIDINLAPLKQSIFNEAKSENKWVEAALCKVVTVASKVGAFEKMVVDEKTGLLCNNADEWYIKLTKAIQDKEYRSLLAENAYKYVMKNCFTTYTGRGLAEFLENHLAKNVGFILPTTNISGGVNVILKHCEILRKNGFDVFVINMDDNDTDIVNKAGTIFVLVPENIKMYGRIHTLVASLWSTLEFALEYPYVKQINYFVQNFETDFMEYGQYFRIKANATYNTFKPINYTTMSTWCQDWLKNDYGKESIYVRNGINLEQFPYKKRDFTGKIKILVEGNSLDHYKNVDESFKIVEKLDKNKFEIHFLSYQGKPKDWYYVDKFMNKVPYDEVGKVYQDADILIKSSLLESFSYPPLEMMATGGLVVAVANGGNVEYLKDNFNCLFYEQGNILDAVDKIELLVNDEKLREKLLSNGMNTVKSRDWNKIESEIVSLYGGKNEI